MRRRQEQGINRHILDTHKQIADVLQRQPQFIGKAREKLQERYDNKLIRYGSYVNWLSILELEHDLAQMVELLCEESFMMDKLRRCSPFIGIGILLDEAQ